MTNDELITYVRQQRQRQHNAYEDRWRFSDEDMPEFNELSPEEQASVCECCGDFLDPETPVKVGEPILCGGDVCLDEVNNPHQSEGNGD